MIDLHIHTTNSDGEFGVVEILEKANLKRLDVISITDHNNINAYDELNNMDIKRLYSGKVIPGVELEFVYNGRLFDMLGYGIDLEVMKKSEIIKEGYVHSTVEGQSEILDKFKHVCDELGIKYSLDLKISKPNHMANDVLVDDILKYSDNKDILDSMNIVDRSSFYRKHFCEVSSPFYIDQTAGKKDIFYVQYAGTMGFNFDYRMVLNVAEILKSEKNIVFQMIGFGSQKDVFENAAKKRGLENIVFFPLEPQEMVPHVYSACSVCLIPLPKGVIGNSVPSKAGLLMACHRVIVTSADDGSEYNKMFEREQIGIAYSTDDPEGVANGILKLRDNPDLREAYADNAQKYGKAVYTRTVNTGLYEDLYCKIGGKAR